MTNSPDARQIAAAIKARQRFIISSHARPDGDSIGSSLAMACALRAIGKHADVVHSDPAPGPLMQFPGVPEIQVTNAVPADAHYDAAIVMECGDLARTGVTGLDHAVRTFHYLTGVPLPQVIKMASLTPARILGADRDIGSLVTGRRADLVLLDASLSVRQVYVGGQIIVPPATQRA